jgi:hypothetical protein
MESQIFFTEISILSAVFASPLRRRVLAALLSVGVAAGILVLAPHGRAAAETLPKQLSDRAFWQMVVDFSEPSGIFRSDNLVSNEVTFQYVIPELRERRGPGGVYVGVGPDQNFTYISALSPRMAFVIDIRRQNMLLHLMYKALVESSESREEFLSKLFSRPRPAKLERSATAEALFYAFRQTEPSEMLYEENLRGVFDRLLKHHGFTLSEEDRRAIEFVYRSFFQGGPDLQYSVPQVVSGRYFPTYAELMVETDRAGHNHGYLASEESYRALRDIERSNMLVPLVGDFGGPMAIRRVGEYLREHGATVSFFYTSNVEQYLFQSDAWMRFFLNVGMMPIDERSVFIRSYFLGLRSIRTLGPRSDTLLSPIGETLDAFHTGRIQTYFDVIERSK